MFDSRGNQEGANQGPEVHLVLLVQGVQVVLELETARCVLTCSTFVCGSVRQHKLTSLSSVQTFLDMEGSGLVDLEKIRVCSGSQQVTRSSPQPHPLLTLPIAAVPGPSRLSGPTWTSWPSWNLFGPRPQRTSGCRTSWTSRSRRSSWSTGEG